MAQEREPPGGLPFVDAFGEFTDPAKHEAWEEAELAWMGLRGVTNPPSANSPIGILSRHWPTASPRPSRVKAVTGRDRRRLQDADLRRDSAFGMAWDDFKGRCCGDEIVGYGRASCDTSAKRLLGEHGEGGVRIAADQWDVLTLADRESSRFEGGGQVFYEVLFHRADEIDEWRRGASLGLALRCLAPQEWANYDAFWAPYNAPEEVDREEAKAWASYDRREFWDTIYEKVTADGYQLRVLDPPDDLTARWKLVTRDVLGQMKCAIEIDPDDSTIMLPSGKRWLVRVFLPGDVGEAVLEKASKELPLQTQIYNCWKSLPDNIKTGVDVRGGQVKAAEELACRLPRIKRSTIDRTLSDIVKVERETGKN